MVRRVLAHVLAVAALGLWQLAPLGALARP
jgi:hypothetical protein